MDCKNSSAALTEVVETGWNRAILGDAVDYCTSSEFTNEINSFRSKYAHKFGSKNEDAKYLSVGEHSLEDTIIFNKYQMLVEGLLQSFVVSKGSTIAEFFAECRGAMENKFCAIFEEHQHHWFVEMLLDWLDFDHFCDSMSQQQGVRDEEDCNNDGIAESKYGHK